jgi:hypothetical protein
MSFQAFSVARFRLVLILASFLLIGVVQSRGQSTSQGTRTRPDPIQKELQRRFESDAIERALAGSPRGRAEADWRAVLLQIRQDFLRIQIINDKIQKSNLPAGALDLELTAKSTAEIVRCAQRLKINLALPKGEPAANSPLRKTDLNAAELRASLSVLDNVINAFVANPVFERSGVVDAKLSVQAARDLEQIILVSKQLKRSSEKLRRAKAAWRSESLKRPRGAVAQLFGVR